MPHHDVSSEEILKKAGYRQDLARSLTVLQTVGLALSDITPAASFFVIAAQIFPMTGTGAGWTFLLAGIIALSVAFSMAELGSRYPFAGGLYAIVTRVLGKPIGFLAMVDYVVQAIFLPASIALGIGGYIQTLVPGINANIWATILMALVTILAVLRVKTNANITGIFLSVELAVMVLVTIVGLVHPLTPFSLLIHPVSFNASHVSPVKAAVILAAISVALFSYNGYDSAINFSEETDGSARNVGKSVMNAASLGVLFQVVPAFAVILADGTIRAFYGASLPIEYYVEHAIGPTGATIVILGVILAVINATLAIVLQFSRVIYSTGRDQSWPAPVNRALTLIHSRYRTPWVSVLVVGVLGIGLTLLGSAVAAITFTSVMIIILYALVAISAIVHRVGRLKTGELPFKMWIWPVPPLVALAGVILAISQQTSGDLETCAAIFGGGFLYYLVWARRQPGLWHVSTSLVEEPAKSSARPVK
ncbi:amino acid transporter [Sulfobacillus acidophilus TPY]|uniref:Amino acid/polyamine/organocation transporter, APC superfamily n=1 Tax=Sulfobacillus acidophilus (strain ATCC 700253 / DSM 10332 / NAL) TaxID=679936 RepID=G8TTL6_SULAD|nr:amino acid transporter [Sulfobacillus acidophilus TPY]AEW05682.1 amino acid/polyamine/organocation transporter, APC superfamily [Sulfobacillus acidophilus DSM 10332]